jgi:Radical SAM superfamily
MAQIILWNSFNEPVNVNRPIGPHILANWLKQHGYTVKVIDFCHALPTKRLLQLTEKHIGPETIAVGVSSTFWKPTAYSNRQHKDYYELEQDNYYEPKWVQAARFIIQLKFPKLDWLLGGHTGVGHLGKTNRFGWIRFKSFAEDQLLKYICEKTGKFPLNKPFDIKNLTSCFYQDAGIQSFESLPIELARGCQFRCKFCSYPLVGKKADTYLRDEHHIKDELIRNFELFGTTRYQIMDDTVNESSTKIEKLAKIVQDLPFKFEWIGYNRLDIIGVNRHTIDLLKASGLKSAYFGIESFHPEASSCLGKGWNGKYAKDFLIELKEKWKDEVSITCSFIAGLPHETEQSLIETQEWLINNKVVDSWFFLQLFLNKKSDATEFEKNASEYGISFPDETDLDYWEHSTYNFKDAIAISQQLNYDDRRTNMVKPMTWYIPNYASLGYDYDEVRNTNVVDLNWKEMSEKHTEFISKYIQNQLTS